MVRPSTTPVSLLCVVRFSVNLPKLLLSLGKTRMTCKFVWARWSSLKIGKRKELNWRQVSLFLFYFNEFLDRVIRSRDVSYLNAREMSRNRLRFALFAPCFLVLAKWKYCDRNFCWSTGSILPFSFHGCLKMCDAIQITLLKMRLIVVNPDVKLWLHPKTQPN